MLLLQAFAVMVSSISVLVIAVVLLRWTASFEQRLKRIDTLIDCLSEGMNSRSGSE